MVESHASREGPPTDGRLPLGTILNGLYRIDALIGRGGMGEVYRSVNLANDEPEAIKVLSNSLARAPQFEALFRREARILRTISHPSIAQYRMIGRDNLHDVLYIVTEFVDGPNLGSCVSKGCATLQMITTLGIRLAEGLRAAHSLGAIHRDLSPDNILLPGGNIETAKIIDFGISKSLDATSTTIIGDGFAGKLAFAAPEQFGTEGGRIGPWTDIYSLGLVLLTMAAGRPLDMGDTFATALERRRRVPDLSPLPDSIQSLFAIMLEPDWTVRFQDMDNVITGFQKLSVIPKSNTIITPKSPPRTDKRKKSPVTQTLISIPKNLRSSLNIRVGMIGGLGILAAAGGILCIFTLHTKAGDSLESSINTPSPIKHVAPIVSNDQNREIISKTIANNIGEKNLFPIEKTAVNTSKQNSDKEISTVQNDNHKQLGVESHTGEGEFTKILATLEATPSADDLQQYYPLEALRADQNGSATLSCRVTLEGLLTSCFVRNEEPEGYGFGDAAMKLAPFFRFRPATYNGSPIEDQIAVPIKFAISSNY